MNLPDEKRDQVAEVLVRARFRGLGGMTEAEACRYLADALAPLLAEWLAEAEELIAALRARVSHAEAERDEAFRVAPNMGAAVYERGKRDGLAEGEARVEAVLPTHTDTCAVDACEIRAALDADAAETTGGGER